MYEYHSVSLCLCLLQNILFVSFRFYKFHSSPLLSSNGRERERFTRFVLLLVYTHLHYHTSFNSLFFMIWDIVSHKNPENLFHSSPLLSSNGRERERFTRFALLLVYTHQHYHTSFNSLFWDIVSHKNPD